MKAWELKVEAEDQCGNDSLSHEHKKYKLSSASTMDLLCILNVEGIKFTGIPFAQNEYCKMYTLDILFLRVLCLP